MPVVAEGHDHLAGDTSELAQHEFRPRELLNRLGQDGDVESVVRIDWQVAVGVTLYHGEALSNAAVDAGLLDLQPPRARAALLLQQLHELAVAAADVEHKLARTDELGDGDVVGAPHSLRSGPGLHCALRRGRPRASAAASMKPLRAASNSGSSTRKAS